MPRNLPDICTQVRAQFYTNDFSFDVLGVCAPAWRMNAASTFFTNAIAARLVVCHSFCLMVCPKPVDSKLILLHFLFSGKKNNPDVLDCKITSLSGGGSGGCLPLFYKPSLSLCFISSSSLSFTHLFFCILLLFLSHFLFSCSCPPSLSLFLSPCLH